MQRWCEKIGWSSGLPKVMLLPYEASLTSGLVENIHISLVGTDRIESVLSLVEKTKSKTQTLGDSRAYKPLYHRVLTLSSFCLV